MHSLFTQKNTTPRVPNPKTQSDTFSLSTFLNGVNPSKTDQSLDSQKELEKLLDVTQEIQDLKPSMGKGTQKFIQKVQNQEPRIPKEIARVSKKISQSLRQLTNNTIGNPKKPRGRPSEGEGDSRSGTRVKALQEHERRKQSGDFDDVRHKIFEESSPKEDSHFVMEKAKVSPKATSHRRTVGPEDWYAEALRSEKESEKPKSLLKEKSIDKRKDSDLIYYDPLSWEPINFKSERERQHKANVNKKEYEQYDPLRVTVVRKSEDEPAWASSRERKKDLMGKRPMMKSDYGSKYETEVGKKVKVDTYSSKKEIERPVMKGMVQPLQGKQYQRYEKYEDEEGEEDGEEEDDYDEADPFVVGGQSEEEEDPYAELEKTQKELERMRANKNKAQKKKVPEEEDEDDEAMAELNRLMRKYRDKIKQAGAYEDDSSDMEVGFDEIEKEDEISKRIGEMEDNEELNYIKAEKMREKKGKIH